MMKSLNEYDTPEFDLLLLNNKYQEPCDFREDVTELCKSLEQRLAACRDLIMVIELSSQYIEKLAKETLTLTAPK